MNDNEIIRRLEALRKFQPRGEILADMKGKLLSRLKKMDEIPAQKKFVGFARPATRLFPRWIFLYPAALLLVLIVATQGGRLIDALRVPYAEARISLASNEYEKARLALDLAELELTTFEHGSGYSSSHIAYLGSTVSETNQYMNSLHLVGEPGQYSGEQCLEAYKAYEEYLESLQTAIQRMSVTASDAGVRTNLAALSSQVARYEQAAHDRVNLY